MGGPVMRQGPLRHTPANLAHPQMAAGAVAWTARDAEVRAAAATATAEAVARSKDARAAAEAATAALMAATARASEAEAAARDAGAALLDDDHWEPDDGSWEPNIEGTRISNKRFTPVRIYGIDARGLMDDWAQPAKAYIESEAWQDERRMLFKMRNDIADATRFLADQASLVAKEELSRVERAMLKGRMSWRTKLEMVGLVPGNIDIPFLESGSSAVHASVFALGLFRRAQLEDDSRASLRKTFDEHDKQGARRWLGRAERQIDVFEIEGIAVAPGLPEVSAGILLSQIEKYAHQERRVVVVPQRACISIDGTNLEEHYVRLGFIKVEMEYGPPQLVYTGASVSATDEWAENRLTMVGVNLWTGF